MTISKKLGTAELLYNCAASMGLRPEWVRYSNFFSISTTEGDRYIYYAKSTLNSHLSNSIARNKHITRLVLERSGLPNIAFIKPSNLADAEQFLTRHSKIIVKPLNGSNSSDVHIVEASEDLRNMDLTKYILEKYTVGKELRYLVLNGKVIAVHESEYGESVSKERDLKRISYPESEWNAELVALALKTAKTLQLRYAAVDYLIEPKGQAYILEVNSSPEMKWFHQPTSGPVIDLARLFLEAMLSDMKFEITPAPVALVTK